MVQERLDGVLVVDKPAGMTSHDVVAWVRRALERSGHMSAGRTKVGHAGTLDPLATGVLLVCLGKATRLVPYLQASAKTYDAGIVLGITTTTLDADGEVVKVSDASALDEPAFCDALKRFVGDIEQIPPMVSAVKIGGERLYAKARRGEIVERQPRPVRIDDLVLEDFEPGVLACANVLVTCSPGTYVRTLAADIGDFLGVGAHLRSLRRLGSGRFNVDASMRPEDILEHAESGTLADLALPMHEAVADFPTRSLDEDQVTALKHGRALHPTGVEGPVAALDAEGRLVAMIEDAGDEARSRAVLV